MIFATHCILFLLTALCGVAYLRLASPQESARNPIFIAFQKRYVPLYLLVLLGDWLQGPYMYTLYHFYSFEEDQVAVIYVCGILSSALAFPLKDVVADRLGRRVTCTFLCLLYGGSCLATLSPSLGILVTGRCLCGFANTILFSALESWYVHEHRETNDFPKEWTQVTFRHLALGSSVVAIGAGLLADMVSWWIGFGPAAPSVLATPIFVVAAALVFVLWTENYGPNTDITVENARRSCLKGLQIIGPNVDLFLVGAIQSLFETTLLVFVYIWTPALNVPDRSIPLGVVFASFMVCYLFGGILCENLIQRVGYPITRVLLGVSGAGTAVFGAAAYVARYPGGARYRLTMLTFLLGFELLCGFYFPIMRILREKVLPEEHRISVINWFRVPLTIMSSMALVFLHDSQGGVPAILGFCAILMALAFICSLRFAGVAKEQHCESAIAK